jgi:archaellum biogenesis ATPase FlaH
MNFIPLDPKLVSKYERKAQEMEQKSREELERSYQEWERQERVATLTRIAEGMRKDGKSKQSIQTALKGIYEYWKWTSHLKDLKLGSSNPANPEPSPALSNEAPGVLLSEVETQQVHWLWPKRIPLGKITILEGDPGMGKSLLAISVAASVSTGLPMPDGTPGKQGGVILIAPEDSAGDTIRPRLQAAGGDPSRVLLLNTLVTLDEKKIKIYDRPISLSHDLETLEERIKQMNAILLIIDPLTAVLRKNIDQSRDQDVREVFTPLTQLAERTNCAVLIIRHLSKVGSANLLYRGAGSIGIIAVARLALIVAPHPTAANKRILATTKNNLSKQATNLAYRIAENAAGVPYIQWLGEDHHDVNALVSNTSLSAQRQAILRVLNNSKSPLALKDIADRTGQDHDRLRKTVHRMLRAGEVASPARGEYTTVDHPCITKPTYDNHDVPAETSETLETLETLETSVPD